MCHIRLFFRLSMLAGCLLILLLLLSACSRAPEYEKAPVKGTEAVFSHGDFKPDMPEFFTYRYKRKNINFFVLNHKGKMLAFLDACVKCYPEKLGYGFENGRFVCRKCGMSYSAKDLEHGAGNCHPIKLNGQMKDGTYRIPLAELEKEADKF
jgi:hypothetical protein